ncbi:hypothetical protein PAAG_02704 [Paracoccidioides lutzii Pb01]|uniref:Restriction of telomere capping protein 4 C-terminal domain-containing protein n=1 Tax=Paracoccidioides lutzii (strain ATCC MYA-826 / Pb01) TaxID=502779 RepID=C1GW09_PARBA|nr:hypothetical protein PAAG_02704 [Paracoccidioides lutzii Pb01]EEH40728.2 hypothetical protein PAAG_02704 [Paracoccidioides lutzii Pb01]
MMAYGLRRMATLLATGTGMDREGLVSKYGIIVYAQEVLMPELLKMMDQKVMRVDVKDACQILKESNKISDLLNDE